MRDDIANELEVGRFAKNSTSVVIAHLVTVHGAPCAGLRVFLTSPGGPPAPTRAGFCIRIEQLTELRALVDQLIEASGTPAAAEDKPAPASPQKRYVEDFDRDVPL